MDRNSFWLADISNQSVTVSLVALVDGRYQISQLGSPAPYTNQDEFLSAFDRSLSQSATVSNTPADLEPNEVALIIPPFWVDHDGSIVPDKKKLLSQSLNDLKLKPMGFVANDEALVEEANQSDGFPASFVIVNLFPSEVFVSLSYLGKIIHRSFRSYTGNFDPSILEDMLLSFNSESALPPQIIVIGDVSSHVLESIRNFTWTGKKNIETFLHFPEIRSYDPPKVTEIYLKTICLQFQPDISIPSEDVNTGNHTESNILDSDSLVIPSPSELSLTEVDPAEIGFGQDNSSFIAEEITPSPAVDDAPLPQEPPIQPTFRLPKLSIPKVSLPTLHLRSLAYLLMATPLLILIPFLFSKATVTLYITPYSISKNFDATFDIEARDIDTNKLIIPINRKVVEVGTSLSSPATGTKIVGEKSTGEVIIYNKQDKTQSLAKGTVLSDTSGRKYELSTSVQVASSSANLDLGVINLGQTKVIVSASDIGPEYNLGKDSKLVFKDFSENNLVAKVTQGLVGGTKNETQAVSSADKANLEKAMESEIKSLVKKKLDQEKLTVSGIISDATQVKNSRFDYNREVGEVAQDLTVTAESSIYFYYLSPDQKSKLLSSFLVSEAGFADSKYNLDDFDISVSNATKTLDRISGQIVISGKSIPKVDVVDLVAKISGKSQKQAVAIIAKAYPRVYDYRIETNFKFLETINPLPFRLQNIKIEVK